MSDPSGVSVVVATDGRSSHLIDVLATAAQDPAVDEVIVVANGDGVHAVADLAMPEQVRVLELAESNLSVARNLGLEQASNEIVAFLDDDAVPAAGWGDGYRCRFQDKPEVGAAGGPAWVAEDDHLPEAFLGDAVGYLALVEFDSSRQCQPFHYPFGCNFALRRLAVREVGGFRSDLGYAAGRLVPHEETELFHRLSKASWELWWEARSRVEHRVAPAKRRCGYLLERAYAQGRGDIHLTRIHPEFGHHSKPLDALRVAKAMARAGLAVATGRRRQAMDAALWMMRLSGRIRGVPSPEN